tara:strand:+ start:1746 stop:2006 length:261 start_codon:yes stop_codon:yes gene_type:complete
MIKISNIIMFLLIVFFILSIYNYYSSNKNIDVKNYNRKNIDQVLKEKIGNLPVLENDTNSVIEFSNSLENEIEDNKNRSFWDLLNR